MARELGVRQPREFWLNQPNRTPLEPSSRVTAKRPLMRSLSSSVRGLIGIA
jgi:hypothetical protein